MGSKFIDKPCKPNKIIMHSSTTSFYTQNTKAFIGPFRDAVNFIFFPFYRK